MSKSLQLQRVECPKCKTVKPRVTLLTSYLVFLQCAKCDYAWELRPDEYPPAHQVPDLSDR